MTTLDEKYADIEHIEAMKEHLKIRQQQYVEICEHHRAKEQESIGVSMKMQTVKDQIKGLHAHEVPNQLSAQLLELQVGYDEAKKELKQLSSEKQRFNEEISLQQKAIANDHLIDGTSLKNVIKHQQNIKNAEVEVDRIQALINAQTPVINALVTAELPLNSLGQQKEDILAEIASGIDLEKQLDEVNNEISDTLENIEAATVNANRANAVVIGLKRKSQAAQQVLVELKQKNPLILECLLFSVAKQQVDQYYKAALEAQQMYIALLGVDSLIKQYTNKKNGICVSEKKMKLPKFNLENNNHPMNNKDPFLFDSKWNFEYGDGIRESMSEQAGKLREAGITLL